VKIDVHAACYPKPYIDELKKIGIGGEGGIGVDIPVWTTAEERIAELDRLGIDVQMLELSAPNVYFPDVGLSRTLAQITNDFIADICRKHPDRFCSFASVALNDMDAAVTELHRAVDVLGMDGVVLGTNVNGHSLSEDQFMPFFEEVDRMKLPVAIHPVKVIGADLLPPEDIPLTIHSSVGFLFETTRSIAEMTFKGTFEKLKNLTFILPHVGGTIPFLYPRWDMNYASKPPDHPVRKVPHPPSHYLKRHYYDTALTYNASNMRCTIELAGIDHLLFGTDWPYTNDAVRIDAMFKNVEEYGFSEEEKEKIYFKNAMNLFPKLKPARA
jgi:predicted TIM-barrel fold metal-dependent hydrolase